MVKETCTWVYSEARLSPCCGLPYRAALFRKVCWPCLFPFPPPASPALNWIKSFLLLAIFAAR